MRGFLFDVKDKWSTSFLQICQGTCEVLRVQKMIVPLAAAFILVRKISLLRGQLTLSLVGGFPSAGKRPDSFNS